MTSDCLPAPEAPPRDVWERTIVGWHIGFWMLLVVIVIRILTGSEIPRPRQVVGLLLTAIAAASYAGLVQRRTWRRGLTGAIYLTIMVLFAGGLCWVDVTLSMYLFIAYAQTWIFSERVAVGALFTTLLTVSCTTGLASRMDWQREALLVLGPQMAVALVFSCLLGWWISRIVVQSQERAGLLGEIEAARAELAESHRAQGAMAERERIAREIHDTLAQGFTSIIMLAQAAAAEGNAEGNAVSTRLTMIEDVARENLHEARALVAASTPAHLADGTLGDALRRIGASTAQQSGLAVEVFAGSHALTRTHEVVVLRAVQEGLANVVKHAQARRAVVRLEELDSAAPGVTRCTIEDDGRGFRVDNATAGYGLAGMRARTEEVGGTFTLASSPGTGTRIQLDLPAPEEQS